MTRIRIDEINPKLLLEKGILSEMLDPKVIALSRVLDALRLCTHSDSVWALEHSLTLLKGEEAAPQNYGYTVIEAVAQTFGFAVVDLEGKNRSAELSLARQVVMYILWRSEKYTLDHIGQLLGHRSPATVGHGFQTVIREMNTDAKLRQIVEKLQERLEQGWNEP